MDRCACMGGYVSVRPGGGRERGRGGVGGGGAPNWPTVEVPPNTRMGLPAFWVSPPASQGAGMETERAFGVCTQMPVVTVASASGMDAAWSRVRFSGTCVMLLIRRCPPQN